MYPARCLGTGLREEYAQESLCEKYIRSKNFANGWIRPCLDGSNDRVPLEFASEKRSRTGASLVDARLPVGQNGFGARERALSKLDEPIALGICHET